MRRLSLLVALVAALAVTGGATARPVSHAASASPASISCESGYYKNVSGICVHSPSSDPTGATARCRDGSYSYSQHASGTCSHHGGVGRWIHHP